MTRWALLIEYDGTGFVGWQVQENGLAVQQLLEAAAARIAGAPVSSICAGRTDAGVHAAGQVVHVDLERDIAADGLAAALNYHLKPHAVVVRRAAPVGPEFSARFSAVGRAYRYVILNRRARPALALNRVWHVPAPLDAGAMAEGAAHLLGRHDFSSFRAASCQAKSPVRTLDRLSVERNGETIEIVAEARSFLHHQVRNMVGTLRLVGEGKWLPARMAATLAACDRRQAGPTAPPEGLTLTGVRYLSDPFGGDSCITSGASSGVG
jgi:tRNA pseudouridine38-40 synthase